MKKKDNNMDDESDTKLEGMLVFEDKHALKELHEKTEQYIAAVKKNIEDFYGKIPVEFTAQLEQLQTLYLQFLKCSYYMKEQNPVVQYSNKVIGINQTLKVQIQLSNAINSLVKNFGLSPVDRERLRFTKGKAKKVEGDDKAPEEQSDFMDEF